MSSLYSFYLAEKENKSTIEIPDKGFVTYKVVNDVCHVCVIYVKPLERNARVARELMQKLRSGPASNCKALTAVCYTKQENTTNTLRVLLHYGFEVVGTKDDDILLYKEL